MNDQNNTRALTQQNGNAQLTGTADMPTELIRMQQVDPDVASRAFAIILARPVDQYNPPLQPARAIAAALYEQQTGQVCGRDFYVDNRMGVVPGYRGRMKEAADRGIADWMDDYRPFTAEENQEHGIQPGDSARVCELTVIQRAKACRDAGITYRPAVGFGIVKASEKVNRDGKPLQLSGGYTWERKARNRALKDALSHAGFAATAAEVLEDANTPAPEGAHLDVRQAQAWARAERQAAEIVGEYRSLPADEQQARVQATRTIMRGPGGEDPLGIDDTPAPQPPTDEEADAMFEQMPSAQAERQYAPATNGEPGKPATVRTTWFVERAPAFVQEVPYYANAEGKPDLMHMRMSAAKAGYPEITGPNLPAVFEALRQRAQQKQQQPA